MAIAKATLGHMLVGQVLVLVKDCEALPPPSRHPPVMTDRQKGAFALQFTTFVENGLNVCFCRRLNRTLFRPELK